MALPIVLKKAISRASAIVDRGALRVMERQMRRNGPRRPPEDARERLVALAAHYRDGSASFFPAPPAANVRETTTTKRIGKHRAIDLQFESTYRPHLPLFRDEFASYHANLTARARLYTGRAMRPTIVCIHGWGGGAYWVEERAFAVSYWLRIGLDVALFQMPYHGERTPRQARMSGALFPSSHVVRTNEAFGQAIHDLRALAGHLRERGAPAIGVTGMSLGGYTTALWASLDDDLAFAVPMIPAVDMSDLMWRHGNNSPARRRAERVGVNGELLGEVFEVHSPLSRPVKLAPEQLLIIAGRGDRITPPDQARSLWHHWNEPTLHWFDGGHLAQVGRGDGFRAIRRHVTDLGII